MHPSSSYNVNTLRIWITRVPAQCESTLDPLIEQLSISERTRLDRTSHPRKRLEYLHSRSLMRTVLSHIFASDCRHWTFIEVPDATPVIEELSNKWHISLSHSKQLIAFSVAHFKHGIDLEFQDQSRNINELLDLILHCEEQDSSNTNPFTTDNFYKIWCAKEAWFKSLPASQQDISPLSSLSLTHLFKKGDKQVFETTLDQHRLAVVAPHHIHSAEIQVVTINKDALCTVLTKECPPVSGWANYLS